MPKSGNDRCRAHISFVVGIDYWGQGIVTTALKIAVSKVFGED
jgi:RimJ/RimL family protein N-acetyltransferase